MVVLYMRRFNIAIGSLLALFFLPLFAYAFTFNTDLSLGDTSSDVSMLQIVLEKEGFFVHEITEYFGPITQSAVQAFQTAKGITPVSGIVGPKTRAVLNGLSPQAPVSTPTPVSGSFLRNLQYGMQGEDVRLLQAFLNTHGSPVALSGLGSLGNETLLFGPATQAALAAFQSTHGITPAAGYFGPITRAYISTLLSPVVSPAVLQQQSSSFIGASRPRGNGSRNSDDDEEESEEEGEEEEPGDTTDPEISDIDVTDVTDESATITWTTDEPADSQVLYGVTSGLGEESTLDTEATTTHTVVLTGLNPNTDYFFRVRSADASANAAASDIAEFSTLSQYAEETQQFFDRLVTEPDEERATAYNTLIAGLVADGVWEKLDFLHVLAAQDSMTARVNLVDRKYTLINYGSPTFNLDNTGYSGTNSTSDYLDTEYNLLTSGGLYARNSASMGAFITAGPGSGGDSGVAMGTMITNAYVYPHYSDNRFYWIGNAAADQTGAAGASTGMFSWTRSGATTNIAYRNGVQDTVASDPSQALVGATLRILQGSGAPAKASLKVGVDFSGAALTPTDQLNLYNRLDSYIQSVSGQSGAEDLIAPGSISSTIVDDGRFNAAPGLTKLQNGTLFAIYDSSTDAEVTDGVWNYKTSSDNGETWSSETTLLAPPIGFSATDVEVMTMEDGTVVVTGFVYEVENVANSRIYVITGSADAETWASPLVVDVTEFTSGPYMSSKAIELGDGTLLLPVYGALVGDTKFSSAVISSDDAGQTWGDLVVVAQTDDVEQYTETNGAVMSDGRIVLIVRHDDGTTGYARVYSDDDGATWSVPTNVIHDVALPGRPDITAVGNDRLFMWGRFDGTTHSRWGYSLDGGEVWTPFTPYGVASEQYFYASSVVISPSEIGSILARQRSSTEAYIVYQNFEQ